MALWKKISCNGKKTSKKKPYIHEVDATYETITFIDEDTKKEKTVLHLHNVSSKEDKVGSDHQRQTIDLDKDSAKQLFEILKEAFDF